MHEVRQVATESRDQYAPTSQSVMGAGVAGLALPYRKPEIARQAMDVGVSLRSAPARFEVS